MHIDGIIPTLKNFCVIIGSGQNLFRTYNPLALFQIGRQYSPYILQGTNYPHIFLDNCYLNNQLLNEGSVSNGIPCQNIRGLFPPCKMHGRGVDFVHLCKFRHGRLCLGIFRSISVFQINFNDSTF